MWGDKGNEKCSKESIKQKQIVEKELDVYRNTLRSQKSMKSTLEMTHITMEAGETYKEVAKDIKKQFGENAVEEIQKAKDEIDDAMHEMDELNFVVQEPLQMGTTVDDHAVDDEYNEMFGHNTVIKPVGLDSKGKFSEIKQKQLEKEAGKKVDQILSDMFDQEPSKKPTPDVSTVKIPQTQLYTKAEPGKVPIEVNLLK